MLGFIAIRISSSSSRGHLEDGQLSGIRPRSLKDRHGAHW